MLSDDALLDFCRSLVSAVRSGLPLSDAFETLSRSRRYGRVVARAFESAGRGGALHAAFAAQRAFPPVFIALLRAGEEGGKIDDFVEIYADCLETRIKFRRQIERLLLYPVFVLLLAGALFLLVSFKVVPSVMEPLMKSGAALPPQAFFFSSLAEKLAANWYKLLLAGALAALLLRWALMSGPGRKLRGLAGHWLPGFRFASAEGRLYYVYTTIALLMKSGLQPGAMMDVLAQFAQDDLVTRARLRRAAAQLSGGEGFARSLRDVLPEDDRHPLEVAEKAGRLDDTLLNRARLHYDRHLHRMKLLVTAFNISTLVAVACVCFGLVLTVAWPAVSMMTGTKDALKSLGLSAGQEAGPEPLPAPAPRPLTPEELRTRAFNENYGGKISALLRRSGPAPAEDKKKEDKPAGEEPRPKKKLQGKLRFGSPTDIRPGGPGN